VIAAEHGHGHLATLKYAVQHNCPVDVEVIAEAAAGGHFRCLQYAHAQRAQVTPRTRCTQPWQASAWTAWKTYTRCSVVHPCRNCFCLLLRGTGKSVSVTCTITGIRTVCCNTLNTQQIQRRWRLLARSRTSLERSREPAKMGANEAMQESC
jgi:hypothetical protein